MGLVEASRRFDRSRDLKFETFAEHRVRGATVD
jgi:RNA polymerase sigma factor for flagellar operon FliA